MREQAGTWPAALDRQRQNAIYAREGIDLDRSTLGDWVGRMAALLDPLVQAIGRHVCAGSVLHADDTTVEVLAPGQASKMTFGVACERLPRLGNKPCPIS